MVLRHPVGRPNPKAQANGKIRIIGVPMDLGAGRRGVDMGPSAMRVAGVNRAIEELGYDVLDAGNVDVHPPEALEKGEETARYLKEIAEVAARLAKVVEKVLRLGARPVVLGGDNAITIGSFSGLAAHLRARKQRAGIIWFDAHTDINTPETTPSGNVHGMPLAALLGEGPKEIARIGGFAPKVRPENVAIIGARSVDPGERDRIKRLGVRVFTMSELDERGMAKCVREAIAIASRGTAGIYPMIDIDFLDPGEAPGVGTPVRGGVTYREAHLAMEKIAESGKVLGVEVTEVNPLLDRGNHTAHLAVELICSVLGKRIL
jgi:arginase